MSEYGDFTIDDGTYELGNGTIVKVWTQQDGQWACAARDHSAFCRRCQPLSGEGVDEIRAACLSNVLDGLLELVDDPKRGWLFRVGPAGERHVEEILARDGLTKADLAKMNRGQVRRYLGLPTP